MKMQRMILASLATLVAVGTAFAFNNRVSKKGVGTLFTKTNGIFTRVACKESGSVACNPNHNITYYTAGSLHTQLPKTTTVFVTE